MVSCYSIESVGVACSFFLGEFYGCFVNCECINLVTFVRCDYKCRSFAFEYSNCFCIFEFVTVVGNRTATYNIYYNVVCRYSFESYVEAVVCHYVFKCVNAVNERFGYIVRSVNYYAYKAVVGSGSYGE